MLAILLRHRVALVISHQANMPCLGCSATSDFAYFRFHGPQKMFASRYARAELRSWAKEINALLDQGHDVYAYFNDSGGHALRATLKRSCKICNPPRLHSTGLNPHSTRLNTEELAYDSL
jgi:uncharacterized protein YecE (DUF72 family)